MATISNEFMMEMLGKTKEYTIVILKRGPNYGGEGHDKIIWEHGRRNFSLRADGLLSIVCPVRDGSEVTGLSIFKGSVEEVQQLMDEDPGVKVGTFVYETHPCRSFPGDSLP